MKPLVWKDRKTGVWWVQFKCTCCNELQQVSDPSWEVVHHALETLYITGCIQRKYIPPT